MHSNLPRLSGLEAGIICYGSAFAPANISNVPSSASVQSRRASKPTSLKQQPDKNKHGAPEKELTLFALRLAVLEKIATSVGALCFVWATAVILGGYAAAVKVVDFWFVTTILVIEGARIFCRSHELEWQHQDTGKATMARGYHRGCNNQQEGTHRICPLQPEEEGDRLREAMHLEEGIEMPGSVKEEGNYPRPERFMRLWSTSTVPIVSFTRLILEAGKVSFLMYTLQIMSATLSTALSLWRLSSHDFTTPTEDKVAQSNLASSITVFYSLALFEAVVFLMERIYWQYQTSVKDVLNSVSRRCLLPAEHAYIVRKFFYDVYATCLNEGVFKGLRMDLVDYLLQWLQEDGHSEQLAAIRGLLALCAHDQFKQDVFRAMGTSQDVVERLLEMVTWKNHEELEIREGASHLLSRLVGYDRNGIRVAAIPGSIQAILSLLAIDDKPCDDADCVLENEHIRPTSPGVRFPMHMELGLRILINMTQNQTDCTRIGATKGLLATLIGFIQAEEDHWEGESDGRIHGSHENVVVLSLKLLSLLVGHASHGAKGMRQDMAKVMSSISSLKNMLNVNGGRTYNTGSNVLKMQELAASILSSMAMDSKVSEVIGRTGGVMKSLLGAFLMKDMEHLNAACAHEGPLQAAIRAGEALSLLVLQSKKNCQRLLGVKLPKPFLKQHEQSVNTEETRMDASRVNHPSFNVLKTPKLHHDILALLVELMSDPYRGHLAIFILHSLCENQLPQQYRSWMASYTHKVLRILMEECGRMQEAALGLAAQLIPMLDANDMDQVFRPNHVDKLQRMNYYTKEEIVTRIRQALDQHPQPSIRLPRIRCFCLELVCVLLDADMESFLPIFEAQSFPSYVDMISNSTSDMENFLTFSGPIGVTMRRTTMEQLVQKTIQSFKLESQVSFS